jgi:hypothetical protein
VTCLLLMDIGICGMQELRPSRPTIDPDHLIS